MLIADLILSVMFTIYEFFGAFDGLVREISWLPERGEGTAQVLSTLAALLLITNFYQIQQNNPPHKTKTIMTISSICLGAGLFMRWTYVFDFEIIFVAFITVVILVACLYLFVRTNDYVEIKQKALKKGMNK